jgi:hypothetical protein
MPVILEWIIKDAQGTWDYSGIWRMVQTYQMPSLEGVTSNAFREGAAMKIPKKIKFVGFLSAAWLCNEHKVNATINFFFVKEEWPDEAQNYLYKVWLLTLQLGLNLGQTQALSLLPGLELALSSGSVTKPGPELCRPLKRLHKLLNWGWVAPRENLDVVRVKWSKVSCHAWMHARARVCVCVWGSGSIAPHINLSSR